MSQKIEIDDLLCAINKANNSLNGLRNDYKKCVYGIKNNKHVTIEFICKDNPGVIANIKLSNDRAGRVLELVQSMLEEDAIAVKNVLKNYIEALKGMDVDYENLHTR